MLLHLERLLQFYGNKVVEEIKYLFIIMLVVIIIQLVIIT